MIDETFPRTGSARAERASDDNLLSNARAGDDHAYAELLGRHEGLALAYATRLTGPDQARDLFGEARLRILQQLRRGGGPQSSFKAYLMTSIRNSHLDALRRHRREVMTDDLVEVIDFDASNARDDGSDERAEADTLRSAFAELQPRWRDVLWLTEVMGASLTEVGDRLEISPESAAALKYRAREGLRVAYLSQHVQPGPTPRCQPISRMLARYARGTLRSNQKREVRAHLAECRHCSHVMVELKALSTSLTGILAPVLLTVVHDHFLQETSRSVAAAALAPAAAEASSAGRWVAGGAGVIAAGVLWGMFATSGGPDLPAGAESDVSVAGPRQGATAGDPEASVDVGGALASSPYGSWIPAPDQTAPAGSGQPSEPTPTTGPTPDPTAGSTNSTTPGDEEVPSVLPTPSETSPSRETSTLGDPTWTSLRAGTTREAHVFLPVTLADPSPVLESDSESDSDSDLDREASGESLDITLTNVAAVRVHQDGLFASWSCTPRKVEGLVVSVRCEGGADTGSEAPLGLDLTAGDANAPMPVVFALANDSSSDSRRGAVRLVVPGV